MSEARDRTRERNAAAEGDREVELRANDPAPVSEATRIVVITGTDTGVGKTVAAAALAATDPGRVLVVKPVQTGVGDHEPSDAETVAHLAGCATETFCGLEEPMAPVAAARREGAGLPPIAEHVERVRKRADDYDTVIVEGAGGLLVELDERGGTLRDLALELSGTLGAVEVVVVCRAGLGTLNHTALTVEAARSHGLEPAGLIIGSWPPSPGVTETLNRVDLERITGVPVTGVLPDGVGLLEPEAFRATAPAWLGTAG